MPIITMRLDEELHRRVKIRAAGAQLSISEFLRPAIEDLAFPGGRYAYTGQDEILGVAIQTYALLAEMAAEQSPAILERAVVASRSMLRDRGLIDPLSETLSGMRPALVGNEAGAQ